MKLILLSATFILFYFLMNFKNEIIQDESTITERLRDAVLACPMLIDGARQRDAAWCLAWNSELNMLESDFMNTVLNNPDVAGAVASDFELTMEHV